MTHYVIDEQLKKRIEELAQNALQRSTILFTTFLTPPEAQYALHYAKRLKIASVSFGGADQSERQMVGFGGDRGEIELKDFPVASMKVTWNKRERYEVSHRDILGAILGTGVDRKHLGDIFLKAEYAVVFISKQAMPIIAQQLHEVGPVAVEVCQCEDEGNSYINDGEKQKNTVASLRLDAVVAVGLKESREKIAQLIEKGLIQVNHLTVMKKDYFLKKEDLISIRGRGRMKITQIGLPNRKKRIPIEVECYGL